MNEQLLTCSDKIKHEYCCTVVQIGECFPIEGADRIQKTLVNGMDMVISKNIKPGDIMIYAANETELNSEFLSVNNLYGISDYALNKDAEEISKVISEQGKDAAKPLCGMFNHQGRVKLIKLRGAYSFGFLFDPNHLIRYNEKVREIDFNQLIGTDFDTVDSVLFVKAYVPRVVNPRVRTGFKPKKNYFEKLSKEDFKFHYDSEQLQREIARVNPTDVVAISVKLHGTSAIFARINCKIFLKLPFYKKVWNWIAKKLGLKQIKDYYYGLDDIYTSRTVIRNQYVDRDNPNTILSNGVWDTYGLLLKGCIPDNWYVYGEIVGFEPGTTSYIQKDYDYKCAKGESYLMPYRIVNRENAKPIELDVEEVSQWTKDLLVAHPELIGRVIPIHTLYHGTLKDLYPGIPVDDNWHKNVLAAMKADKEHFGMEESEPLCNNKVPREGICLRIDGDPRPENFKLKSVAFLAKEGKNIDAGVVDTEMEEVAY